MCRTKLHIILQLHKILTQWQLLSSKVPYRRKGLLSQKFLLPPAHIPTNYIKLRLMPSEPSEVIVTKQFATSCLYVLLRNYRFKQPKSNHVYSEINPIEFNSLSPGGVGLQS